MINLSGIYKNFIVFALILGAIATPGLCYADEVDEMLEDAEYAEETSPEQANLSYINDIEILGANIIKPTINASGIIVTLAYFQITSIGFGSGIP